MAESRDEVRLYKWKVRGHPKAQPTAASRQLGVQQEGNFRVVTVAEMRQVPTCRRNGQSAAKPLTEEGSETVITWGSALKVQSIPVRKDACELVRVFPPRAHRVRAARQTHRSKCRRAERYARPAAAKLETAVKVPVTLALVKPVTLWRVAGVAILSN